MESVRVDRYIWAIRSYKTRSAATDACRAGHVKINGASVKPAHLVHVGDDLVIAHHEGMRELHITQLIDKRVGAAVAATCYIDNSPVKPSTERLSAPFVRDASTGRPTKRDRRRLDRLRNN